MGIVLRTARLEDAEAITRLHVRVWRQTYGNLVPTEIVEKLTEAHRLPGWKKALANPGLRKGTVVAEMGEQVVGFVNFGPASQPELGDAGEVKYLYVDEAAQGAGVGRALHDAALSALVAKGFHAATLAVFEENTRALAFYKVLGGTHVGSFTDAGPVWRSHNHVLSWSLEGRA